MPESWHIFKANFDFRNNLTKKRESPLLFMKPGAIFEIINH